MKNIVIFSGTTEGRMLSSMLSKDGRPHHVCVATEYGKEVMEEDRYAKVHVGRMDEKEMEAFFGELEKDENSLVFDATHPYATEVTENIKNAAKAAGLRYARVKRGEAGDEPEGVMKYPDVKAIASAMNESTGRMLLTTGSKELECFFGALSGSRRADVFVRVLPTVESIELCEKQGVASDHIIAMQGPFTAEMNEAVIRQYDIKHLITKNSGSAGGYREKLDAARHTGTGIHVVERPGESEGITVEEAYRMVAGKRAVFSLIGIGMGNPKTMTLEAKEAIEGAEAVFGAVRLIKDLKSREKYEMYMASDIIPVLEREDISNAAVIFSGDIGFYSGAMGMYKALREWKESATIRMIPGVSSFSYLASRLGETYDDAYTFSIHGKNIEENMGELTALYEKSGKVYVLLSDASDIKSIAEKLIEKGLKGNVYLGSDLSYESEIIREMTFEKAAGYEGKGLATALIKDE